MHSAETVEIYLHRYDDYEDDDFEFYCMHDAEDEYDEEQRHERGVFPCDADLYQQYLNAYDEWMRLANEIWKVSETYYLIDPSSKPKGTSR